MYLEVSFQFHPPHTALLEDQCPGGQGHDPGVQGHDPEVQGHDPEGQGHGPEGHDQGQGQRLTHCHPPLKTRTQQSVHVQHAKQKVTKRCSQTNTDQNKRWGKSKTLNRLQNQKEPQNFN